MGESHVLFHKGFWIGMVRQGCKESGDLSEPPNMFIPDPTFTGFFTLRVAGEKSTVVFLEVSILMPTRGQHAGDVGFEPRVRIVGSLLSDQGEELLRELEIYGVVPSLEILVVMNALHSPEGGLIVKDVALFVQGLVV